MLLLSEYSHPPEVRSEPGKTVAKGNWKAISSVFPVKGKVIVF